MRGPGNKAVNHIRRTWRCPACGYERHVSGAETAIRCRCSDGPFMKLVAEPRFHRPQNKAVDVYFDADELLGPPDPPAPAASVLPEPVAVVAAPATEFALPAAEVATTVEAVSDADDCPRTSPAEPIDPAAEPQSPRERSDARGTPLPERHGQGRRPREGQPPDARPPGSGQGGRRRRGRGPRGPRPPAQ